MNSHIPALQAKIDALESQLKNLHESNTSLVNFINEAVRVSGSVGKARAPQEKVSKSEKKKLQKQKEALVKRGLKAARTSYKGRREAQRAGMEPTTISGEFANPVTSIFGLGTRTRQRRAGSLRDVLPAQELQAIQKAVPGYVQNPQMRLSDEQAAKLGMALPGGEAGEYTGPQLAPPDDMRLGGKFKKGEEPTLAQVDVALKGSPAVSRSERAIRERQAALAALPKPIKGSKSVKTGELKAQRGQIKQQIAGLEQEGIEARYQAIRGLKDQTWSDEVASIERANRIAKSQIKAAETKLGKRLSPAERALLTTTEGGLQRVLARRKGKGAARAARKAAKERAAFPVQASGKRDILSMSPEEVATMTSPFSGETYASTQADPAARSFAPAVDEPRTIRGQPTELGQKDFERMTGRARAGALRGAVRGVMGAMGAGATEIGGQSIGKVRRELTQLGKGIGAETRIADISGAAFAERERFEPPTVARRASREVTARRMMSPQQRQIISPDPIIDVARKAYLRSQAVQAGAERTASGKLAPAISPTDRRVAGEMARSGLTTMSGPPEFRGSGTPGSKENRDQVAALTALAIERTAKRQKGQFRPGKEPIQVIADAPRQAPTVVSEPSAGYQGPSDYEERQAAETQRAASATPVGTTRGVPMGDGKKKRPPGRNVERDPKGFAKIKIPTRKYKGVSLINASVEHNFKRDIKSLTEQNEMFKRMLGYR